MSTFQVWYNGTRIIIAPIQFDPRSQFFIVLLNKDDNDTVVKFMLQGIADGFIIRNFHDEELENLSVYEIIFTLLWDPTRKLHADNK